MKLKKLFLGCNLSSIGCPSRELHKYVNHLKVTINSCIENTDLDVHVMYCGVNDKLLHWLKSKPIRLIDVSDFDIFSVLEEHYKDKRLMIARGAWQRVIIPQVCELLGYNDNHVLYTDIDVIFTENMKKPIDINVDKFACVIEGGIAKHYNTGTMIINVPYFDSIYEPFINFCITRNFNFPSFDQGALNQFVNLHQITVLDHFEWNFAPYMHGDPKNSRIVHFHGPKAHMVQMYLDPEYGNKQGLGSVPLGLMGLLNGGDRSIMHEVMDMYNKYL